MPKRGGRKSHPKKIKVEVVAVPILDGLKPIRIRKRPAWAHRKIMELLDRQILISQN